MEHFTFYPALSGGILIGLAAALLLLCNGRIAGISGIMGGLIGTAKAEFYWRFAFLAGIVIGAALLRHVQPDLYQPREHFPIWLLASGGFLVGFGTRLGNGCTSGHAICGIARLSIRSIAATLAFMASGFLTVYIIRHVLGFMA
jgi:uncharacterized protein